MATCAEIFVRAHIYTVQTSATLYPTNLPDYEYYTTYSGENAHVLSLIHI